MTGSPVTEETDLIVVGAGAGGMTAALTAALQGLRVVLCEASEQVGGTTATSAGTLWVPGNQHAMRAGMQDDTSQAAIYLNEVLGPDDRRNLRRTYLETAATAIDYLERHSDVAFSLPARHPDYIELPGAAVAGRALSTIEFDGRLLGRDFARIRSPLSDFLVLGGMMANKDDVQSLIHRFDSLRHFGRVARLLLRYGADRLRYKRGTRLVLGNALVGRLFYSLRQAGVKVCFGTRLQRLEQHKGRVSDALFDSAGKACRMRARIGIVLATGGIGHNHQLRTMMARPSGDLLSLAFEGVRGDGIDAALNAGAQLERHVHDFFYQPVSVAPSAPGKVRLFPHIYLDRAKPGLIAVNRSGERFVNEGASYHHFVEGMVASGGSAWLICDARFIQSYGLGVIRPGTRNLDHWVAQGYLTVADSLAELAARLGISGAGLEASVLRNNEYAKVGHDMDFGKGDTEVSRFNGDAQHRPNPCLGPIAQPPFCALPIYPADAASSSGLATDGDGVVLTAEGRPLTGLYACGNDMASMMQGAYPGPGTTLGPAMVFGYRVGMHAKKSMDES
jgi:succinate dehydrogenase/fumarate reductase flavoprotein subunit